MKDIESLQEFVRARGPALSKFAYLLTCNHDRAQDLVQSALVKVVSRWHRIARGNPEAYLRRVIYNERTSLWRRHRYTEAPLGEMPDRAVGDGANRTEQRMVLINALSRLSPRQRAVVVLRFYEDRSEAEVAEILGIAVGTVKSQAHRALSRLREVAPELRDLVNETRMVIA